MVVINHANRPHAGSRQIHQDRRAQPAGPDHQNTGLFQTFLPRPTDFTQYDMPGITLQFRAGKQGFIHFRLLSVLPRLRALAQSPQDMAIGQDQHAHAPRDQPQRQFLARCLAQRMPHRQPRMNGQQRDIQNPAQRPPPATIQPKYRAAGPDQHYKAKDQQHQPRPVDPKPPAPRVVSLSPETSEKSARTTGATTICAIRSPWTIANGSEPAFMTITPKGPR